MNLGGQSASIGSTTISGSKLNIVGTFTTAQIRGIYTSTQVTLAGGGVLDNTNDTLALDATTGSWIMAGGTLKNGTLTESGGAELAFTSSGGTLDGVTADNNLDLSANNGANVNVVDGLTLNSTTIALGNAAGTTYGYLYFGNTETLGGTGTLLFGKSGSNSIYETGYGDTLTLGSSITVRGSSGRLGSYYSNSPIINQGTISADDTGGGAWSYDHGYSNSSYYTASTANAIDTSGVTKPAPQEVYQTARSDYRFGYTLGGLTANTAYTLRLHFADFQVSAAGQRVFNVSVNGTQVLTSFDIYAAAGGSNKAVVESIPVTTDANGQVDVSFATVSGSNYYAQVNGLEIDDSSSNVAQTVNAGLLAGGTLTIDPSGSFTNQGTISTGNGETLALYGTWTNASGATISATGSTLSLGYNSNIWANNGAITVTASP